MSSPPVSGVLEASEDYAKDVLLVVLAEIWLSVGLELSEIQLARTHLAILRIEKAHGAASDCPRAEEDKQ